MFSNRLLDSALLGISTIFVLSACSSTEPPSVASVVITPSNQAVASGSTLQLSAKALTDKGKEIAGRTVSWSVTGSAASISPTGLLSANRNTGSQAAPVVVTAAIEGVSGSTTITVGLEPVGTIAITSSRSSLAKSDTLRLQASAKAATGETLDGRSILWAVNDTSVGTISGSGLLQMKRSSGSVVVSATSEGKTASTTISAVCFKQGIVATGGVIFSGVIDPTDCPSTVPGLFYDSFRFANTTQAFWVTLDFTINGPGRMITPVLQDTSVSGSALALGWQNDVTAANGGTVSTTRIYGPGSWTISLRNQTVGANLSYTFKPTFSSTTPAAYAGSTCLGAVTMLGSGFTINRALGATTACLSGDFYEHYYDVYLAQGQTLVIDQSSSAFDTEACVLDYETRQVLLCNDDRSSSDSNSLINFTSTSSKFYRVLASSYDVRASGSYSLKLTPSPVNLEAASQTQIMSPPSETKSMKPRIPTRKKL